MLSDSVTPGRKFTLMLQNILILAALFLVPPLALPVTVLHAVNVFLMVTISVLTPFALFFMYYQFVLLRRTCVINYANTPAMTSSDSSLGHAPHNASSHSTNDGNSEVNGHSGSGENGSFARTRPLMPPSATLETGRYASELFTTPLWMLPSRTDDWKRIPLVPYESYSEYQTLLRSTSAEYAEMIERVLISVKNSSLPYRNSTLKPWSLSHYGFLRNVTEKWINEGEKILLGFTKNLGRDWCNAVSRDFTIMLNTAVRVFVANSPLFELARSPDASFDEYQGEILGFLQKEIAYYMSEYDLIPFDRGYTFSTVNFVYYGRTYRNASAPSLTYRAMDENYGMLPVGKLQAMMLAFAMGTYNSKTNQADIDEKKSPLRMLTDDHLRIIFRHDIFLWSWS